MSKWKPTVIVMGAILVNWVIEATIHTVISKTETLSEHLFRPDAHEIGLRVWSTALIVVVVIIASKVIEANRAVKIMEGLIPICAWCKKKIRTEVGEWQNVDQYLNEHGEVEFTHGMCPGCYEKTTGEKYKSGQ